MRICYSSLLLLSLIAWMEPPALAGNITYFVEPVMLSNGYAIEGGFITTDGTIGTLEATNILDYEVTISGEIPYVFRPTNPSSSVLVGGNPIASGPTATNTHLIIPKSKRGDDSGGFSILAHDNTLPACSDCRQQLLWVSENSLVGGVLNNFLFSDTTDQEPDVFSTSGTLPFQQIVIATVPEPSSLLLSFSGMCVAVCLAGEFRGVLPDQDIFKLGSGGVLKRVQENAFYTRALHCDPRPSRPDCRIRQFTHFTGEPAW